MSAPEPARPSASELNPASRVPRTTTARPTWLIVIDPQRIFADPSSDWASPFFDEAMGHIAGLAAMFGPERTIVTRWLPTADRSTAWGEYFRTWPFADVPADDPLYELVDAARGLSAHPTVDEPTFGKWGPQLAAAIAGAEGSAGSAGAAGPGPTRIVLAGVSTDCCVIATALAAADAGVRVDLAVDACAASSAENGAAALHVMGLFAPQIVPLTSADLGIPSKLSPS